MRNHELNGNQKWIVKLFKNMSSIKLFFKFNKNHKIKTIYFKLFYEWIYIFEMNVKLMFIALWKKKKNTSRPILLTRWIPTRVNSDGTPCISLSLVGIYEEHVKTKEEIRFGGAFKNYIFTVSPRQSDLRVVFLLKSLGLFHACAIFHFLLLASVGRRRWGFGLGKVQSRHGRRQCDFFLLISRRIRLVALNVRTSGAYNRVINGQLWQLTWTVSWGIRGDAGVFTLFVKRWAPTVCTAIDVKNYFALCHGRKQGRRDMLIRISIARCSSWQSC